MYVNFYLIKGKRRSLAVNIKRCTHPRASFHLCSQSPRKVNNKNISDDEINKKAAAPGAAGAGGIIGNSLSQTVQLKPTF